tara:strand:+ start:1266 stop:1514 length:249 start_codon:yes stop_codon:yes gene_type:complete
MKTKKPNLKNRWNVIVNYGKYKFEELVYFEDNKWHWEKWMYVLEDGIPEKIELYKHESYPRGRKLYLEDDAPWLKTSPKWNS